MYPACGLKPWTQPTYAAHGLNPWMKPMSYAHVGSRWNKHMDYTHGLSPWTKHTDYAHGLSLWTKPMDEWIYALLKERGLPNRFSAISPSTSAFCVRCLRAFMYFVIGGDCDISEAVYRRVIQRRAHALLLDRVSLPEWLRGWT